MSDDMKSAVRENLDILRALKEGNDLESIDMDKLSTPVDKDEAASIPDGWPTLCENPEKDYGVRWTNNLRWSASELLRIDAGEKRPAGMGGDVWKEEPDEEWILKANWLELVKSLNLLDSSPAFTKISGADAVFEDDMTSPSAPWESPEGLEVSWGDQYGASWSGKTDKLAWCCEPTSGTWLWLNRELDHPFVFEQEFHRFEGPLKGSLLILALCASPVVEGTSWEKTSGPTMAHYYNNFDSYHFSVSRAASGYNNLRRCGPGLVMLANETDPATEFNRWYKTSIVKCGGIVDLYVDGELSCSYLDQGHFAPILHKGRVGIRHVQRFEGGHRKVRILKI